MPDIEVRGIHKRFGDVRAVSDVSFSVEKGDFFGLLGPNGAGKTTTISMLIGLARPDGGTISIGGVDCSKNPRAAQHLIGVVPDESNLYPEMTGLDNIAFCGALYGLPKAERLVRAKRLLDEFGLSEAGDRLFGGYSKGMKRRLTIAAGIIHEPPILFLDEPTTGIDVASARAIRQRLAALHASGTTILLTTHYIEEAERLCTRVAFIVKGRILRVDSVSDLLEPVRGVRAAVLTVSGSGDVCEQLSGTFPALRFDSAGQGRVRAEGTEPFRVGPIVRFLEERGVEVEEARKVRPSLEDIFVRITGLEAESMKKEKEKGGGNG
jgi:ABC-2 type transport system ATP-binding protein